MVGWSIEIKKHGSSRSGSRGEQLVISGEVEVGYLLDMVPVADPLTSNALEIDNVSRVVETQLSGEP